MIKEEHEVAVLGVPQGPGPVVSTLVNIQTEPAVHDHITWSLLSSIYFNFCCLGLAAYYQSIKSRDRKMVGDMTGAQSYASTAKCLNVCALILSVILFIFIVIHTRILV
ncbi:interferon induced transmembrane protein 2 [Phyllostomus discolor]|uniref:Interferon induced transmembrane protein 2 n=1 Tax=Phyllostomus discolor TaxID=89673 RepID=A0A834A360_9CHIR|nr:interferon induced transmembrane protein 2 [Phyllostomus discolor]